MRIALIVALVLAACGKQDAGSESAAIEPDERCDPMEKRVCVKGDVVECDNGKLGRRLRNCHDGCRDGRCRPNCSSKDAALIYVVDTNGNFLSFDPKKLPGDPFHLIGRLGCNPGASPFSMSVDRHGTAWVLYNDGSMYKVSIEDARCLPSGYRRGSGNMFTFGMGFVTDAPGSDAEKLYIAGDRDLAGLTDHTLASIDTEQNAPKPTARGHVTVTDRSPELTGTSEAKLYGFFPNAFEPAFVQEIDRNTGALVGTQWKLGDHGIGNVEAWAFAQWGGKFFLFVTEGGDSTVRVVDRTTGKYSTVMDSIPYRISGAGVSTCAPERDQ